MCMLMAGIVEFWVAGNYAQNAKEMRWEEIGRQKLSMIPVCNFQGNFIEIGF